MNRSQIGLAIGLITLLLLQLVYARASSQSSDGSFNIFLPLQAHQGNLTADNNSQPATSTPTAPTTSTPFFVTSTPIVPTTPTSTPAVPPTSTPSPTPTLPPDATAFTLTYTLDRSNVPTLTFNDLTVNIYVGQIGSARVWGDDILTFYTYDENTGYLTVTTDAENLVVELYEAFAVEGIGSIEKAAMKDNKAWAWSHGFDDNVGLEDAIDVFNSYGWRGTLFMIGETIDDTREEEWWITDAPALKRHLANGWSLGSHSWSPHCDDPFYSAVKQSFDRLEEIVADSGRPNYKIISFASPCFVDEYHPIILDMRNGGDTNVQFDESGDWSIMLMDSSEFFTADGRTSRPFDYDIRIGRDGSIDNTDLDETRARFDWLATHSAENRHFWYNTLAHGDKESQVEEALAYLYHTYGPGGTDEVWVAPSDHIYSYQLVKDRVNVSLVSITER